MEAVKPHYLVLSLPEHHHALAFAATQDFNLQSEEAAVRRFSVGERVTCSVQVRLTRGGWEQQQPNTRQWCWVHAKMLACMQHQSI